MTRRRPAPSWLSDAVIYQIYPASFADADGDGIGDLPGVTAHLDHLAWLGVNTIWISPCFASEFGDGGYDVSDYLTIAPRYGTNDDALALIEAAREHGIRVMFDLVPGHTSHRHPWFQKSAHTPGDDRYIWSERLGAPVCNWIPNQGARGGFYLANFYPIQPALNFGYARMDPEEPWRQPVDAPGPRANRAALREIMAYWFDRGVAGFRVDMAASLVKDDPDHAETGKLWREMRDWMDTAYPDRALLSEWGDPKTSVPAGIHADFFLHFNGRALRSLWDNGTGSQGPWGLGEPCYFDPDGKGSMEEFLAAWKEADDAIDGRGLVALPTANHDFSRLTCGPRTREMVAPAFAFQLTWPALPVIYYGDEIGMRYVPGLPDKEGSQLGTEARQGSRTPMQWDDSPGAGFSTAPAEAYYLPLDPGPDRPSVAAARADERSLLHHVRRLIALRRSVPALGTTAPVEVLSSGYPFVYLRDSSHLVVINPRREPAAFEVSGVADAQALDVSGVTLTADGVRAEGFAHGVFRL
ncbi:alpha-amylase family glycosyl hydrolase [Streptomyces sp. RB6PN25]|uniref:Alpha-amylase family glycosyl hydrolase n=1 Tax=Streptomyces humicola TaxID=2953240 RepID=A0ABT1PZ90_9ACTN|nr:alpha-amylase family glycosyl hydrolase [Streptomyces humicola]MCQ4082375.1 alpha-amylase family glycosyl hydrolase [Streptomyces humicola]